MSEQTQGQQQVQVQDVPGAERWQAVVDGADAGFASYRRSQGTMTFLHTVVDPAFEGRGVGSALVRTALDAARAEGLAVVPRCSFVRGWIASHPDYQNLVAQD